jgi:hypothetical protein
MKEVLQYRIEFKNWVRIGETRKSIEELVLRLSADTTTDPWYLQQALEMHATLIEELQFCSQRLTQLLAKIFEGSNQDIAKWKATRNN